MTASATPDMPARYDTVLLDLDHTLLDSQASENAAFAETIRSVGLEPTDGLFSCYADINAGLWRAVERGETTPVAVRLTRFQRFVQAVGIDADAEAMATAFTDGLGNNGELYPGARTVLERLADHHTLALVTNGLSEVQRARIERLGLDPYFAAVVISAEVGVSKPGTEIFDIAFERVGGAVRRTTIMIGDSLTSDIQGGVNYGIDTCWYDPSGRPPAAAEPGRPVPTFQIEALAQLPPLLRRA